MKELIIEALTQVLNFVTQTTPRQKKVKKSSVSIRDVDPLELPQFIKDNNIPNDAYFDGTDNGYDAWDDIVLSWKEEVEKSMDEFANDVKERFNEHYSFKAVFETLTKNGYKRKSKSPNPSDRKNFHDTTVYDMYAISDFDRLVEYYSLYFEEI